MASVFHSRDDLSQLLRRRDGIYADDLLLAAVAHLDLFGWLKENPAGLEEICRTLDLARRPTDVMLTLFRAMGLVEREREKFLASDRACRYLVEGGSGDLRAYFGSLRERPVCRAILGVLKSGVPISWSNDPKGDEWATAMEDRGFAEGFTAAMDARGRAIGPALARAFPGRRHHRLLDVAGGSGIYATELLTRFPHLSGAILEKPTVRATAEQVVGGRGLSDRLSIVEADMFADEWPRGFDLHLFSHVLHDWDEPEVRELLMRSFRALEPGGTVAIHDAHLNREKDGPLFAAEYSVLLMVSTRGKCYSLGEMEELLRSVGFERVRIRPTAGFRSVITARKPRREHGG